MARSHVVIRKSSVAPPSATVQLSGLATNSGLGTLARIASSRRDPSGVSGTVSIGSVTTSPFGNSVAEADWSRRSAWTGVTYFTDFRNASDFTLASTNGGHVFAASMNPTILARVVQDTTDGLTGGACLRIDTPADAGANSAAYMIPLNAAWTTNAQSFGASEFYATFRFKIPSSRLSLSNCGGNQRGWKWVNFAQYSPEDTDSQSYSNTLAECVLQDNDQRGLPQGYHREPGGTFPSWEGFAGDQVTLQNAVDRGPDYGGGDRYCHYPNGTPGCFFFPVDEWMSFLCRFKIPSYNGSSGNEFDCYFHRYGETVWTPIIRARNFSLGSPNSNGGGFTGINGMHLLTYETNRLSTSSGNVATHHKYDQVIVGTSRLPVPRDVRTSGTTLASTAGAMSVGTWQQYTPSNDQNTYLGVGGVTGSMLAFIHKAEWNQKDKCIEIMGEDHSYGSVRYVRFTESTNNFSLVANDAGVGSSLMHGYDHVVTNPHTGDLYFRPAAVAAGAFTLYRKPRLSSTFSTMPSTGSGEYFQFAIGMCWWSGEFTGASTWSPEGYLMVFNSGNATGGASDGQVLAFNPTTRTWVFNQTAMAPNYGSGSTYHSVMAYSTRKNVAVYGGGNVAPNKIWRLNMDGTKTALTNVPGGAGLGINNGGAICEDPMTGNFLLLSNGGLWELNPDGVGTWTQQTGARVPPSGVGQPSGGSGSDHIACVPLPEHGVIGYIKQTSTTGGTFYLYKHAV